MSLNGLATEATATATNTAQPPSRNDTLAGLTKYIPTESMTLYIATVSAQKAISEALGYTGTGEQTAKGMALIAESGYWAFVILTPILMAIFFLRRIVLAGQTITEIQLKDYPWWKIVASTLAFSVWALAVPSSNSNMEQSATAGVVYGFLAMVVSTFLSLIEPFFEKQN